MRVFNLLQMAFTSIKTSKQTIQAMLEYFSLKNKELWSGTLINGSKLPTTINSTIEKYKSIGCVISVADGFAKTIVCHREIDGFYGGEILANWSTGGHITAQVGLVKESDGAYTMSSASGYIGHTERSSHDKIYPWRSSGYHIVKIIGIEPVIPTALSNIIGGGTTR